MFIGTQCSNLYTSVDTVIQRMISSLTEAQVRSGGKLPHQKINQLETAVLAFLYLSPRSTPAGKMLERLYTSSSLVSLNEVMARRHRSSASRGLSYTDAMKLVLRSFKVKEDRNHEQPTNPGLPFQLAAVPRCPGHVSLS